MKKTKGEVFKHEEIYFFHNEIGSWVGVEFYKLEAGLKNSLEAAYQAMKTAEQPRTYAGFDTVEIKESEADK